MATVFIQFNAALRAETDELPAEQVFRYDVTNGRSLARKCRSA